MLKSYILSKASNPSQPPKKRKRRSEADKPSSNTNLAEPPSSTAESYPTAPPDLDRLLQADIAGRQTPDAREQSYQLEKRQKYHQDAPKDDMTNTTTTPKHTLHQVRQQHSNTTPSTRGWTAPTTANAPAEPINFIRTVQHANIPNPSTQPVNYIQTVLHTSTPNPATQAKPDTSSHVPQPSNAAIDAFPKEKQRHIHGLLSRLQGNVDHLQQQLNFLKAVLGVPMDEPADVSSVSVS